MTRPPLVVGWKWWARACCWTEVCSCWPGAPGWLDSCETARATEPAAMAATAAAAAMKGAGRGGIGEVVMMTSPWLGWSFDGPRRGGRTECEVRRWRIHVRVSAYVPYGPVAVAS